MVNSRQCNCIPTNATHLFNRQRNPTRCTIPLVDIESHGYLLLNSNGNGGRFSARLCSNGSCTTADTGHDSSFPVTGHPCNRRIIGSPVDLTFPVSRVNHGCQGNFFPFLNSVFPFNANAGHRTIHSKSNRFLRLPVIPKEITFIRLEINFVFAFCGIIRNRILYANSCTLSISNSAISKSLFIFIAPTVLRVPRIRTFCGNRNCIARIVLTGKICHHVCLVGTAFRSRSRHNKGAERGHIEGHIAVFGKNAVVNGAVRLDVDSIDELTLARLQLHAGQRHSRGLTFRQSISIAVGIHQGDIVCLNAHNIHADGFHQGIHVIIADSIAHGVHLNGNAFRQNSGNGSLGIAGFGSQGLFRSFGGGRLIVDHHGVGINLLIFNTFGQGNSSRALGQHQFGGLIGTQSVALDFGGFNLNDFTGGSFTGDFLANGFFGSLVEILHRIAHHHRLRGGSRSGIRGGSRSGLRSRSRGGLRSRSRGGLRGGSRSGLRSGSRSGLLSGSHSGLLSGSHNRLLSGSHSGLLSGSHSGLLNGSLRRLLGGNLSRLLGGNLSRLLNGSLRRLLNGSLRRLLGGNLSRLTGRRRCRREFIVGKDLDRRQGSQHRKDQQNADHAACLEP